MLAAPNVKMFNAVTAEDLVVKPDPSVQGGKRVAGAVTNWCARLRLSLCPPAPLAASMPARALSESSHAVVLPLLSPKPPVPPNLTASALHNEPGL